MRFTIEGIGRDFTSIKDFRQARGLPNAFGVSLFELKDYAGLGSIEAAGADLQTVRAAVLHAVRLPRLPIEWMVALPALSDVFRDQLYNINDGVRLKAIEIDFAVAGFSDVLHAAIYEQIRAHASRQVPIPFESIYRQWLTSTLKISQTAHLYHTPAGAAWEIHIVTHAYGRFGLIAHQGISTDYLYDPALACPAQGYMLALLTDVGAAIYAPSA